VRDFCPGPCDGFPYLIDEIHGALLFTLAAGSKIQLWRTNDFQRGMVRLPSANVLNIDGKLGDRLFFTAGEDSDHAKLWSTDGTPAGTVPVAEPLGSALIAAGFYTAGDFAYYWTPHALWRTDGTAAGTVRLKSIAELTGQSQGSQLFSTAWNGLFFSFLNTHGLIRSDGTPDGTFQVAASVPGFVHPVTLPAGLVFSDGTFPEPESLWRTRGTAETTEKFFQLPTDSYILAITTIGDRALVKVNHILANGTEIWVTDGTAAGTRRLEGISAKNDLELAAAGAQGFFPAGDDFDQAALWRTDGTEAGTYPVLDLSGLPASSGPVAQTAFNGRLVFSARTSSENTPVNTPLFSSDGSPGGTRLLSSKVPKATGFTPMAGRLFFSGDFGLWKTDGSPGGTERVEGNLAAAAAPVVSQGRLLFAGADDVLDGNPNFEIWRSDGRTAVLVKEINPFFDETTYNHNCIPEGSQPGPGAVIGDHLVFAADDGVNGRELWTTDGTADGTRLVRDINPKRLPTGFYPCDSRQGTGLSSDPEGLIAFRHGALFTADDGKTGRELWWTDGTHNGTHRVVDLRRGAQGSMPHDLAVFRGAVYFIAADDAVGEKLWRTDCTAPGTVLVSDLKINGTPSWARELTVSRDRLFLAVYNESTGAELWTSRGDAASTHLVVDLRPGEPGSYPQALTDIDGVLVFAADDGVTGLEPWRSDGTAAGTRRLGDINPGHAASSPGPFTLAGDTVFTGAYDAEHGRELWAIPLQDVLRP